MKAVRAFFFLIALMNCSGTAFSLQATPLGALEEMVTTDKLETLASHLPVKVEETINSLGAKEKEELSKKLLFKNLSASQGINLHKAEDGVTWELRNEKGELEGSIKPKNSFVSGDEALVALEFIEKEKKEAAAHDESNSRPARQKDQPVVFISMRLQEGTWRVIAFAPWEPKSLEEEFLGKLVHDVRGESEIISTLRVLNADLYSYRAKYPEVGLPVNLASLAGGNGAESSSEHAKLLDPSFMAVPLIRSGYKFQYTMSDPGIGKDSEPRYQITATPIDLGKSRSFFTDQSGVIRTTSESRDANENDEPVN